MGNRTAWRTRCCRANWARTHWWGVLLERSEYAYYAEQGILKAHAAFLPFITSYPDDRINFCMEDGDVAVLLTSRKTLAEHEGLKGQGFELICMEDIPGICGTCDDASLAAYPASDAIGRNDLAYCIYTSGSTGRPKGVLIEQGNLANYVQKDEKSIEIMHYASPGMVSLAMAAFSFDVSIVEQFVPLCNGNTVCLATEEEIHNPLLLAKTIMNCGVTGITCTPTFLMNIVDMDICREALRQIRFYDIGAEAFPSGLYGRLRELREDSIILNVYGPTECTMGCSSALMEGEGSITIGGPMVNTCFYVMNDKGEVLDVGEKGELIICGDCVGRGYVKLPEKTAKAFFTYQGMRAYHSGDLASWTPDGRIQIWGRIDNQIKLRGFRIELDEIEQVMSTYPNVKGSAVKLCHRSNGSPDRAAVIIAVKRIKKGSVFTDEGELGSGGSGIDSQEAFSVIPGKIRPLHARLFMTAAEFVILLLGGEERIHAPDLKLHVKFAGEPFGHTGQRHKDVFLRVHGTAHSGEQVGIFHIDRMLVIELQGAYKRFFELGEEVQRSAQKGDMTPDGLAAGQSADGLIDHCLENRGSQVLLGGSFIDQGLDIGLGENTAAGRDRIKGAVSAGIGIEPRRIGLQEACHLIDE